MSKKYYLYLILIFIVSGCAKQEPGPFISRHSDNYKVGDQWYCPICNKPVKNGDRSGIDPNLCLSEWHDTFLDADFFEQKMNNISDKELFKSLQKSKENPKGIDLEKAENKTTALLDYFNKRKDNHILYMYDKYAVMELKTIEEFLKEVKKDPQRKQKIIDNALTFAHPDSGYRLYGHNFGWKINYQSEWKNISDYSVNGLGFLQKLCLAWLVTKDDFYRKSFEDMFNQWYDQKDNIKHVMKEDEIKVYGTIWYELATDGRIYRLIDAFRAFGDQLAPDTRIRLLKIILGQARWLYECLYQNPFHAYNWQTHTAVSLPYAALNFCEFNESEKWLDVSKKNMVQHFEHDFNKDGGYIERSSGYTNYAFGMFYRFMLIFKYWANDDYYLKTYLPKLERVFEFTSLTLSPTGVNCPFNDDGRNLNLAKLVIEMGDFLKRGDFIGPVEHLLTDEQKAKLSVKPIKPKVKSLLLPDSKYAVMRTEWDPKAYFMMINYGEFKNHGHYDILDFEIYANGIPIAVDAGLGLIGYIDPLHVPWYKVSRSHNMVTVNDANCYKRDIAGEDVIWSSQNLLDYFAATHRGYEKHQQTINRRHFVFVKNEYWLIFDQIDTPKKKSKLDWNFHTPLHMDALDNGYISKETNGAAVLFPASENLVTLKMKKTGRADLRGIDGEEPNRDIDWLIFRKMSMASSADDHFGVVVYPVTPEMQLSKNNIEQEITFDKILLEQPGIYAYKLCHNNTADIMIFSDGEEHQFTEDIKGDFKFGWFRKIGENPTSAFIVQGQNFEWQDKIESKPERSDFEIVF